MTTRRVVIKQHYKNKTKRFIFTQFFEMLPTGSTSKSTPNWQNLQFCVWANF